MKLYRFLRGAELLLGIIFFVTVYHFGFKKHEENLLEFFVFPILAFLACAVAFLHGKAGEVKWELERVLNSQKLAQKAGWKVLNHERVERHPSFLRR